MYVLHNTFLTRLPFLLPPTFDVFVPCRIYPTIAVPVHPVRDGQGEGRQAHAVAAPGPAQEADPMIMLMLMVVVHDSSMIQ